MLNDFCGEGEKCANYKFSIYILWVVTQFLLLMGRQ